MGSVLNRPPNFFMTLYMKRGGPVRSPLFFPDHLIIC